MTLIADSQTWATLVTWTPSCSLYLACLPFLMTCWGKASLGKKCPSTRCSGTGIYFLFRVRICGHVEIHHRKVSKESHFTVCPCIVFTACRRFAHLLAKKDVGCPETKKDLLRKVKSAISSTAERFSGNMQNVRLLLKAKAQSRFSPMGLNKKNAGFAASI